MRSKISRLRLKNSGKTKWKPNMKLTTQTKPLIEALKVASAAIARKSTLPQLSCALVEGRDGKLFVTCDNLDSRLTVEAGAIDMEGPFKFLVSPRLLTAALRDEEAEIDIQTGKLVIQSGGRTVLQTMPVDEFPPIPAEIECVPVDGSEFIAAALATINIASTDASKYVLNSIFYDAKNSCIVATNGAALSIHPCKLGLSENFIIPSDHVRIITGHFSGVEGLMIGKDETRLTLKAEGLTFTARLMEGMYPNYRQVIPSESRKVATMDRSNLQEALNCLGDFADSESGKLVMQQKGDEWEFSAATNGNESSASVAVEKDSDLCKIGISRYHLTNLIRGWMCDEIRVDQLDECSPLLLRPKAGGEQLGVIMPMRI